MPKKQSTRSSGQEHLVSQLKAGGINVALRAHVAGAHLQASLSSNGEISCPIRFHCTEDPVFRVDRQSGQSAAILLAFVWNAASNEPEIYALPYHEAVQLLEHPDHKDHTQTLSWRDKGAYSTKVNATWRKLLSEHQMQPKDWAPKIQSLSKISPTTADIKE